VALQDSIKTQHQLERKLAKLEAEKKDVLKKQTGFLNTELGRKAALELGTLNTIQSEKTLTLEDTQVYATWKKEISDQFSEQADAIKFAASESYDAALRQRMDDYDIFMAIAKDIGYDATGRETKINELTEIGNALREFIAEIEIAGVR
jgi:type I restriction enzyme M protein